MRKSFENRGLPATAGRLRMSRIGSGQAEISKQKITKGTNILFCPN